VPAPTARPTASPAAIPVAQFAPVAVPVAAAAPVSDDPFADLPSSADPLASSAPPAPVQAFRGPAPTPHVQSTGNDTSELLARAASELDAQRDMPVPTQAPALLNANTGIGLMMMIAAAVWFIAGLKGGIIFFYPPVLFILGLIQFGRGLMGDSD